MAKNYPQVQTFISVAHNDDVPDYGKTWTLSNGLELSPTVNFQSFVLAFVK
jgi:hypothetical protein